MKGKIAPPNRVKAKNGKAEVKQNYPTTDLSTRNDSKILPTDVSLDSLLFKPRNLTEDVKLSKFQIARNQQNEADEYLKRLDDDLEITDPVVKEAVDLAMGKPSTKKHAFHVSQVSYVYDLGFKSTGNKDKFVYIGSLDSPQIKIAKPRVKSERELKQEKMDLNERYLVLEMVKEMSKAVVFKQSLESKKNQVPTKPIVDDDSGSDIFETDGIDYVAEIKEKVVSKENRDKLPLSNLFSEDKKEELKVELPFNFEGGRNLQHLIQNSHKIKVNRDADIPDDDMEMEVLEEIDGGDGVNYDYDNFYDSDSDGEGGGAKKQSGLGDSSRLNQDFQKLDNHFAKKYGSGLKEDKSGGDSSSAGSKRKADGGVKKSAKRAK